MSVISLKHHLKRGIELPAFLGIKGMVREELAFEVGTKVMRFSSDIILVDLKNVLNFWRWSAGGEELLLFFESHLPKIFGPAKFCFAHHPFQCVLNLECQEESFSCLGTPQGDLFFRQQSWNHWERCLQQLKEHLPKSERGEFSRMIGRWQRFIQRMKIARPFDLLGLKQDSLERRFGKWLGKVWDWSFREFRKGAFEASQGDLFGTNFTSYEVDFPWLGVIPSELPSVKRYLDYSLLEWEHMTEFLKEDLQKLLKKYRELGQQRVSRIEWVVTFESLEEYSCAIIFRNPHSLLQDAPDFKTFLYQAYYSYLSMMKKVEEREENLDYPIRMAASGWKLIVSESLRSVHLNEDLLTGRVSSERLDMENKLPHQLENFSLKASFFPENSFSHKSGNQQSEQLPWLAASKRKPLFVFKEVEPLKLDASYKRTFLERVSSRWWLGSNPELGERDYYLLEDIKGVMWWAFQDKVGGWYKHGLFS